MAICKGCGRKVGCSCKLKNGLCIACRTYTSPPLSELPKKEPVKK